MVWKSNLNENDQELIEDLGQTVGSAVGPSPALNGGITSNRKAKQGPVTTQQISAAPAGGAAKATRYT